MSSKFAFDSLVVRDDRVFGWGWYLSERAPARRVELVVHHPTSSPSRLRCVRAGIREDLAHAYPRIAHAASGGYLIQGRLPAIAANDRVVLRVELSDGFVEEHDLPGFPQKYLSGAAVADLFARRRILQDLLQKGDFAGAGRRVLVSLRRRFMDRRRRTNGARTPAAAVAADVLIFDHAMGGGANRFRDERIEQWRGAGKQVLLVTPHLPTLEYELTGGRPGHESVARFPTLAACLAAIGACTDIVLNDLVSFDDPFLVLDWIEHRKRRDGSRVVVFVHDYFAVCPSWSLIDDQGRYCGVPSLDRCRTCLPRNEAPFLALLPPTDMAAWRERWRRFLAEADEIRAFSRSSLDILGRAFPRLDSTRIAVAPHRTDYLPDVTLDPVLDGKLVIGVVGAIGANKGAAIVNDLARLVEQEGVDARVVVIGTLEDGMASPALVVTGPYQAENLPALMQEHGISVCLLPSICPETFSYVAAEIMHYRMPLAVFDLGAPAERVRDYELGAIIPAIDPRSALDAAFALRERLRSAMPHHSGSKHA